MGAGISIAERDCLWVLVSVLLRGIVCGCCKIMLTGEDYE